MNEPNINPEYKGYMGYVFKHQSITWSAVVTGALLAFGLTLLFNLLLFGIGLVVYNRSPQGNEELAFWGFVITLIGGTILLAFAGWKTGKLIKHCPIHYMKPPEVAGMVAEQSYRDCGCYHGLTHGFLAWVLYLIISLAFFSVIASNQSYAFMRSPYLATSTAADGGDRTAVRDDVATDETAAQSPAARRVASPTATEERTAHDAGVSVIAVFLIFLFGAAGCAIGSFLGLLSNKKYYAHMSKVNKV